MQRPYANKDGKTGKTGVVPLQQGPAFLVLWLRIVKWLGLACPDTLTLRAMREEQMRRLLQLGCAVCYDWLVGLVIFLVDFFVVKS